MVGGRGRTGKEPGEYAEDECGAEEFEGAESGVSAAEGEATF